MIETNLKYNWNFLGEFYSIGDFIERLISSPTIYKFSIIKDGKEDFFYIGETKNLKKRLYQYQNAHESQKTNIYIKNLFEKFKNEDYSINVYKIFIDDFSFENKELDLESSFDRKLIESLVIMNEIFKSNEECCLNKN